MILIRQSLKYFICVSPIKSKNKTLSPNVFDLFGWWSNRSKSMSYYKSCPRAVFHFGDSQSNRILGPRSIGTDYIQGFHEELPTVAVRNLKEINKSCFPRGKLPMYWLFSYSKEWRRLLSVPFVCLSPELMSRECEGPCCNFSLHRNQILQHASREYKN